ncbi:hypothetical protein R1sor_014674 [Riccia sorocarpa]|uniref:Uncharacterized protein n=1 Tax=Riccia sorocarpa TaxID=122646 RepID=A0ABD3HA30_9MARC
MDLWIELSTTEANTELVPCVGEVSIVDVTFCASRWKLQFGTIHISKWSVTNGVLQSSTVTKSTDGAWELAGGGRYRVFGIPSAVPLTIISPRSSTVDEAVSSTQFSVEWPGVAHDSKVISTYNELRNMRGRSELSKLNLGDFAHQLLVQLPDRYNGNVVFELPPKESKDLLKKGERVPPSSHVCAFCSEPPVFVAACPSYMFYVTPSKQLVAGSSSLFSRLAIHVGSHDHPTREAISRERVTTTSKIIADALKTSPKTSPSHIRLMTTKKLTKTFKQKSVVSGISKHDTHRHDKVAKTVQAVRLVRGKIHFGPKIDEIPSNQSGSKTADIAGCSAVNTIGRSLPPAICLPPANVAGLEDFQADAPPNEVQSMPGEVSADDEVQSESDSIPPQTRAVSLGGSVPTEVAVEVIASIPPQVPSVSICASVPAQVAVKVLAPIAPQIPMEVIRNQHPVQSCQTMPADPAGEATCSRARHFQPDLPRSVLTQPATVSLEGWMPAEVRGDGGLEPFPTEAEIKVLVDAYTENVTQQDRTIKFQTRNGRRCRAKLTPSNTCLERLSKARTETMRVAKTWEITEDNGSGAMFKVITREDEAISNTAKSLRSLGITTRLPSGERRRANYIQENMFLHLEIGNLRDAMADLQADLDNVHGLLRTRTKERGEAQLKVVSVSLDLEKCRLDLETVKGELAIIQNALKDMEDLLARVIADYPRADKETLIIEAVQL